MNVDFKLKIVPKVEMYFGETKLAVITFSDLDKMKTFFGRFKEVIEKLIKEFE